MKKRLLALTMCLLLLVGCSSILERSYSSHTAHADTSGVEDPDVLRAETYEELLECVLELVRSHEPYGTIRLYNYAGAVENDLARLCDHIRFADPLGAYAVRAISCDSTRVLTYYEVDARIVYAHTAESVAAIVPAAGQEGLRTQLESAVAQRRAQTVLYLTDYEGSAQQIEALANLALYADPAASAARPMPTITLYPDAGEERVLELRFNWTLSAAEQVSYSGRLAELCAQLLAGAEGEVPTVQLLAELLGQALTYDPGGSRDPADALEGVPANDLGALLAMEALCTQAGISAQPAMDSTGAQVWLIVSTPAGYRHLLPKDLRPDPERDADWQLPLYTDEELSTLGFQWQAELFPACVDYSG